MVEMDEEVQAIQTILNTLSSLNDEARSRVAEYVFRRLTLTTGASWAVPSIQEAMAEGVGSAAPPEAAASGPRVTPADLRTLREEKQPHSAIEMAVLATFYSAELAPLSERQDAIDTKLMQRYFKQAGYPLPKAPAVTLAKAAGAGYLDLVSRGRYRLNPVGYNLVAHTLPRQTTRPQARRATRRISARASKKTAQKGASARKKTTAKAGRVRSTK